MKSPTELSTSKLNSENCNYIVNNLVEGIDQPHKPPRSTLNKLKLIEFCMANGSLKFKMALENSIDFRILKNYQNEDDDELVEPIRNLALKLSELIDKPEDLKKLRDEAQKLRERIKGVNNENTQKSLGDDSKYGGYSNEASNSSYENNYKVDLSKKLGITEKKPEPA